MYNFLVYETCNAISTSYDCLFMAIYDCINIIKNNNINSLNIDISLREKCAYDVISETLNINNKFIIKSKSCRNNYNFNLENNIDSFFNDYQTFSNGVKKSGDNIGKLRFIKNSILLELKSIPIKIQIPIEEKNTEPKPEQEPEFEYEKISELVDKLEEIKKIANFTIDNIEEDIKESENVFNSNIEKYNSEALSTNKENDKFDNDHSIFISQKITSYKTIYNSMIETGGISFDKIPPLFITKFPIFLFMDGKDCRGNDVRKRILDTDDEYVIFTILYEVLIDNNGEDLFENIAEKYMNIVEEFIDFLPNGFQAVTEKDIMDYFNQDGNNENNAIFLHNSTCE